MTNPDGALRAWIDVWEDKVIGAFVGKDEVARAPAARQFRSSDEARRWIETEAAALGLPVEWCVGSA